MSKILDLVSYKILENRLDESGGYKICVICDDPKVILSGLADRFREGSITSRSIEKILTFNSGSRIYVFSSDPSKLSLRGFRFDMILVEGDRERLDPSLLNEVIVPMTSVYPNVPKMIEMGLKINNSWKNQTLYFSDE